MIEYVEHTMTMKVESDVDQALSLRRQATKKPGASGSRDTTRLDVWKLSLILSATNSQSPALRLPFNRSIALLFSYLLLFTFWSSICNHEGCYQAMECGCRVAVGCED